MTHTASPTRFDAISEEALVKLVYGFYDQVRKDAVIGPVFERALHDKWESHLPRMVDFWSTMLLGSRRFSGNVYGKHMALDGIAPEHFVRWLTLFKQTAHQLFAPEPEATIVDTADRIAASLQLGYFGEQLVRADQLAIDHRRPNGDE
jgi:hemoglobin